MFNFSNVNKGTSKFDFQIPENTEFCKLSELQAVSTPIVVRGFYINKKGKFADHPVAIVTYGENVKLVDLPSHMTDTITDLMADDDAVSEINAGHCGLKPTSYTSKKYNRQCYGADFYNIE